MLAGYHVTLAPYLARITGSGCRFEPSCSRYCAEVFAHLGLFCGLPVSLRRLLRCRPGGGMGYDPPPCHSFGGARDRTQMAGYNLRNPSV